jgi:hypothetical protein
MRYRLQFSDNRGQLERGPSTEAADSGSNFTDESIDERDRLLLKIEKNRDRLKRIARDQESETSMVN